jgi:hypothetical protein
MLAQSNALGNRQIKAAKPQRGGTKAKRNKKKWKLGEFAKRFAPPLQGLEESKPFTRPLAWPKIELRLRREKVKDSVILYRARQQAGLMPAPSRSRYGKYNSCVSPEYFPTPQTQMPRRPCAANLLL